MSPLRWREAGVLEMYLILVTPDTPPGSPHCSEIVEIALRCRDQVEGVPVFMGASAGLCYWIMSLSPEKSAIQAHLLLMRSECRSYPGLDARTAGEIDEALCRWLKFLNEVVE